MKNKIVTLKQLKEEKKLTQLRLREAESNLIESFNDLKEEFKPVTKVVTGVSNLFHPDEDNLLSRSVGFALNGILKKGILRNAGFITKYGLSYVATAIAKNYVAKNSGSILDWFGNLLHKKDSDFSKNGRPYDASTAHSDSNL